jgi:ATP-dependent DNA helicase RecQ
VIEQTLADVFGYTAFRPGQDRVVRTVLAGRSAAAIFPTGSGKSLCYQLPALLLPHLTLVISPLLALMQDQLAFLKARGIAAASIDSAQRREDIQATMAKARTGELKVLMISVERLKNERFRQFIAQVPISLLVVDEAHCLSEWGHNFRPDYLKLPDYQRDFNIPQVLLLTATATPRVIADMQARFGIADNDVVTTGFYRSNLDLQVEPVSGDRKQRYLLDWVAPRARQSGIVYVTQQRTAEQLAEVLVRAGIDAGAYHAGLPHERREVIQQQFMDGTLTCIVATIAFGMGIDKRDIRYVVHYDLPKSVESYSQEIGRAGRDGEQSECLMLANRDALNVLENFVYGDTPEQSGIQSVLEDLQAAPEGEWSLQLNSLSDLSDIRLLPLKTLLVQLELQGLTAPQYSYFADYRFKYIREPEALIEAFEGERRQFVEAIVETSVRARTWCTVNFDRLHREYRAERGRVIAALEWFHERGWIELESKQMTEVYRRLQNEMDIEALSAALHRYFQEKEQAEVARTHAMLDLFASDRCLSRRLAEWFGDTQAPEHCGHCSVCRGAVAILPAPAALPPLDRQSPEALCGAFREQYMTSRGRVPSVESMTRFLCGLSTPAFTRLKARSLPGFAALEAYPYAQVRTWLAQAPL